MAATLVTTIKRFIGTAVEMAALAVTEVPAGSTFFQSDTGRLYVLNSAGNWNVKRMIGDVNMQVGDADVADLNPVPCKLTGRNVILGVRRNVTVTAGATLSMFSTSFLSTTNLSKVYAYALTDTNHNFTINLDQLDNEATLGMSKYPSIKSTTATGVKIASVSALDMAALWADTRVQNSDTVDHVYDVVVGGIK